MSGTKRKNVVRILDVETKDLEAILDALYELPLTKRARIEVHVQVVDEPEPAKAPVPGHIQQTAIDVGQHDREMGQTRTRQHIANVPQNPTSVSKIENSDVTTVVKMEPRANASTAQSIAVLDDDCIIIENPQSEKSSVVTGNDLQPQESILQRRYTQSIRSFTAKSMDSTPAQQANDDVVKLVTNKGQQELLHLPAKALVPQHKRQQRIVRHTPRGPPTLDPSSQRLNDADDDSSVPRSATSTSRNPEVTQLASNDDDSSWETDDNDQGGEVLPSSATATSAGASTVKYQSFYKNLPPTAPVGHAHIILRRDGYPKHNLQLEEKDFWLPDMLVTAVYKLSKLALDHFLDLDIPRFWFICLMPIMSRRPSWSICRRGKIVEVSTHSILFGVVSDALVVSANHCRDPVGSPPRLPAVPRPGNSNISWSSKNIRHNFYACLRIAYQGADESWIFQRDLPHWDNDLHSYNQPIAALHDPTHASVIGVTERRANYLYEYIRRETFEKCDSSNLQAAAGERLELHPGSGKVVGMIKKDGRWVQV